MCGAPLWSSKCTYVTSSGIKYGRAANIPEDHIVTNFFGIFFLIFQSGQIWGNLIASQILKPTGRVKLFQIQRNNNNFTSWHLFMDLLPLFKSSLCFTATCKTLANVDCNNRILQFRNSISQFYFFLSFILEHFAPFFVTKYFLKETLVFTITFPLMYFIADYSKNSSNIDVALVCGARYCPTTQSAVSQTQHLSTSTVYTLLSIYLGFGCLAILVIALFLDRIKTIGNNSTKGHCDLFVATIKHLRQRDMQLLIPLTVFSGLEQGFVFADFTKVCQFILIIFFVRNSR